ncbi:Class II aldolase/adducin family protein [Hyella patelloides LEGE 07179]|uniref:Class II aldolase/adducin family protein n=1 Tax=Hyella patelloides LEGE 07179 TaxID=945734 RepID=A0A563W1I5_9CYAN|nr:class II aldolase/adducin family protein [Hyella patelloides]VEP17569.1 Class II aldolase/adducin family protein [Hyella patelloides LEGE 07179]
MIDEGYIKYQCHWTKQAAVTAEEIATLNQWRNQLYQLGLIGQYDNGIGFGNVSCRLKESKIRPINPNQPTTKQKPQFIISGTQTGGISQLTTQHYTKVTDFNWEQNYVTCVGAIKASSESLTHGALYVANPEINAVIHIHNLALWQKLLDVVPTTNPNCAYGTPEMAEDIIKLCQQLECQQQKIIVMSGHKEGIITFGNSIQKAGNILLNYYRNIS